MWKTIFGIMLTVIINTTVQAEPEIIYDTGQTTLLKGIKPNTHRFQFAPPPGFQAEFTAFPVVTPSMTPGRVLPRKINRPFLNQPIFIVGVDKLSLTWLNEHKEQLIKHRATGIAVNVKTQKELDHLIQASGGLPINPVRGTKIARQLSLKHYPVLVSSTRIEQ